MKIRDFPRANLGPVIGSYFSQTEAETPKGRGAIRADFGPMSEINSVVIKI